MSAPAPGNQLKLFKKGDTFFKEGDRLQKVFIIQSGLVSVFIPKPKKNIEIYQASMGHLIGEEALVATGIATCTAIAIHDTKAFEIPLDALKLQLEQTPTFGKWVTKGLHERLKAIVNTTRTEAVEKDNVPCPPDQVAKVFGVIFHAAKHLGKLDKEKLTVEWQPYKKHIQRIFLESPIRLEQALTLLTKLKWGEFQKVKNDPAPDAPEEIGFFHFNNLNYIEQFFDFYQSQFFKGTNPGILKVEEKSVKLVAALLKISEGEKIAPNGVVSMNLKDTLEKLKEPMGKSFSADQFDSLERKGIFVKRESNQTGGLISFYRDELDAMLKHWKVLQEIDKWNEKGFVDLNDNVVPLNPQQAGLSKACPQCQAAVFEAQKFCGECGHRLTAAQAA